MKIRTKTKAIAHRLYYVEISLGPHGVCVCAVGVSVSTRSAKCA